MASAVSEGTKRMAREISLNCSYEFRRLELPSLIKAVEKNGDKEALEMLLGLKQRDKAARKRARERARARNSEKDL